MKKILLDTNFLMAPYQFKVDIFSEIERILLWKYEIEVLDRTIEELEKIIEIQKGKNKEAAKIALKLVKINKIKIVKTSSEKSTDDVIVDYAVKEGCIVATQDKDLKRELINHGIGIIILKSKKKLMLVNDKGFN